ncbi:hypothetical protein ACIBCN_06160 [Nocardia sp. NPDC051052]|uniref:hypothetical protein n=1 Tax=Nocardia sp. NPDC051052 TaxID=3364322 RepID=UPI0037AEF4CA
MSIALTTSSVLTCGHASIKVRSSSVLKVNGSPVLLQSDFTSAVFQCTTTTPTGGPCKKLAPFTAGVSKVLTVGGEAVVLADAEALTDASAANGGKFTVVDAAQTILDAK